MRNKAIFFVLLTTLFIILATLFLSTKKHFDRVLNERLILTLNDAFKGRYKFSSLHLNTNLFTGSAIINGIKLSSYSTNDQADLKINIDAVSLSGLSVRKLLLTKELEFYKIKVSQPDIFYNDVKQRSPDKVDDILTKIPDLISGMSHSVSIKSFEIENGKVRFVSVFNNHITETVASLNSIKWEDLAFDKGKTHLLPGNLELNIEGLSYTSPSSNLKIAKVEGNSKSRVLSMENIYSTGIVINDNIIADGKVNQIKLIGLTIPKVLKNYQLTLNKVIIDKANVNLKKQGVVTFKDSSLIGPSSIKIESIDVNKSSFNLALKENQNQVIKYRSNVDLEVTNFFKSTDKEVTVENLDYKLIDFIMRKANETLSIGNLEGSTKMAFLNAENLYYHQKKAQNNPEVSLSMKSLLLKELIYKKLMEEVLDGGKLLVKEPKVSFYCRDNSEDLSNRSLNQLISRFASDHFKETSLKNVAVYGGELLLKQNSGLSSFEQEYKQISLFATNVRTNSKFSLTPLNNKNFRVRVGWLSLANTQGNFKIKAENLKKTFRNGTITGENITINQYRSNQSDQPIYFTNTIASFRIEKLDFDKLLNTNVVEVDKLTAKKMGLHIEIDERKESNSSNGGLVPRDILNLIPFTVKINKLKIQSSELTYRNIPRGNYSPALLTFNNLNLFINNISNESSANDLSTVNVFCKLQNKAHLNFTIKSPLMAESFKCRYSGKMTAIDARRFNEWFAFADIGVRQGKINLASFDIAIVNGVANGKLLLEYENFKLNILKTKNGKKSKVKSFLSQFFIKKSNKTNKKEKAEYVRVECKLDKQDSFLYKLWHPLKVGMVETVTKDFYNPLN